MFHQDIISIYTDGAARGNPGPGGWGCVILEKISSHLKEIGGWEEHTTNNRMELVAVIEGLKALKTKELPVTVYSDSKYVVDAITKGWLNNWIKTNFKGGKKNKDLWMQYYKLSLSFQVRFVWVKGHASNPFNNRCDQLATNAADGASLAVDTGFEQENGLF